MHETNSTVSKTTYLRPDKETILSHSSDRDPREHDGILVDPEISSTKQNDVVQPHQLVVVEGKKENTPLLARARRTMKQREVAADKGILKRFSSSSCFVDG